MFCRILTSFYLGPVVVQVAEAVVAAAEGVATTATAGAAEGAGMAGAQTAATEAVAAARTVTATVTAIVTAIAVQVRHVGTDGAVPTAHSMRFLAFDRDFSLVGFLCSLTVPWPEQVAVSPASRLAQPVARPRRRRWWALPPCPLASQG